MPFLAAAAPYIALATTAVSAINQTQMAEAAGNEGRTAQIMAERNAKAEQAIAQQQAAGERKKARYLRSRAIAVAGASGAGVSDPTVSSILTGIDTEGEMNALNAIYSGDIRAESSRYRGGVARREGDARKTAGYTSAFNTAFSGATEFAGSGATFFSKYGDGGMQSVGVGTGYSDFSRQPRAAYYV